MISQVMRLTRSAARRMRRRARILADEGGASTLEFTLLLAAIAIPLYGVFRVALALLFAHYQMITFLNGWPFP